MPVVFDDLVGASAFDSQKSPLQTRSRWEHRFEHMESLAWMGEVLEIRM